MPLVTCLDCKAEVSDAAPACPKCGRPLAAAPRTTTNHRRRTWAAGGFVIGVAASAIAIKQAWGPAYTYETLSGVILVVGLVVGGVCAGLAFMFGR